MTHLLFPRQCAGTTAAKQILPLLAKTTVIFRAKVPTRMNSATLSRTTAASPAYRHVQIVPATDGAVRSFIASDTWRKTSFSAPIIGSSWRPATKKSPQLFSLSQHSRPNRLHPTPINQHALGCASRAKRNGYRLQNRKVRMRHLQ